MLNTISNFFSIAKTTRTDGYLNVFTGLNTARSKNSGFRLRKSLSLTYHEIDALLRDNAIAHKICKKPAEEITRKPIKFKIEDPKKKEIFEKTMSKFYPLIQTALFWEQGFGGSAILLDIDDGNELDQPVQEEKIKINGLGDRNLVFDKSYVNVEDFNIFKDPETFFINFTESGTQYIHRDRLLLFTGNASTILERLQNRGFSDSVLDKLHIAIRSYTVAHDTCSEILNDFSQTVFKIEGLNAAMGKPELEKKLISKLNMLDLSRSTIRALALDKNDDFDRKVANLTGIKEFLSIFKDFLISLTNFPRTILMGENPEGGLGNKSGETQLTQWYDFIIQYQTRITPEIQKLINYIASSLDEEVPEWEWDSLWEMDKKETAELEAKEAESFLKYTNGLKNLYETQALSSDEINQIVTKSDSYFTKMTSRISELLKGLQWK